MGDCGPFETVLNIWRDLLNTLGDQLGNTPLDPLIDMLQLVTDFLDSVCSSGLSIGIQLRVNTFRGIVPYDTFFEFQGNKLRLSDLPVCDAGTHGVPPSPHSLEQAHNHPQSRCKTNDDCFANDGSYKNGFYHGKNGYCLNHPNLYTVVGCLGRCIKKMAPGQICDKSRMNIFHLARLDFTNAEHAACQSGQCTCGVCTDANKKIPNGGKCATKNDCQSGWCEGDVVVGCKGICRAKRKNGQRAWHGNTGAWSESCESGKEQCGTCVSSHQGTLPNGAYCSGYAQCQSGWCEGDVVTSCRGKCQRKRNNGEAPWKGWQRSCVSGKEQCGTCVASYTYSLPNGKSCSGYDQCQSGWCEGHVVTSCRGKCQRKRNNGESAWHGWQRSCVSGREQCGSCTSGHRDLPSGHRCSKNSNCRSNWCGCGSWWCTSVNCNGRCD